MGCGSGRAMDALVEADEFIWRGTVSVKIKNASLKRDVNLLSKLKYKFFLCKSIMNKYVIYFLPYKQHTLPKFI